MKSSFFNATSQDGINWDRVYDAADFAEYFDTAFVTGVVVQPLDGMMALVAGGMNVKIKPGDAFIKGYHGRAYGDDILTVELGEEFPRRDLVAIRLDMAARDIYPLIIRGTAAEAPARPEFMRTAECYDLVVAEIAVPANATEITQLMITDLRGNNEFCPWFGGIGYQLTSDDLNRQIYEATIKLIQSAGEGSDNVTINLADAGAREEIKKVAAGKTITDMITFI